MNALIERDGARWLLVDAEGPLLCKVDHAADLVGEAFSRKASVVVVPAERLDPAFFRLRTGLAGAFIQKIVNYRLRFAVIGDISGPIGRSDPLRDFVWESNRGREIFFLADLDAVTAKFAELQP
jgi:hypothetical protein